MRKCVLFAFIFALCSLPAAAQDYPKAEFFGGYQYTHLDPNFNASGWNASIAGNLNHWFGVAADFSGAYDSGVKFHTYMFGPVVSYRQPARVTPFAHVLIGGARASGGGTSTSGFSMAVGGGMDAKVTDHLSWRILQGDWLMIRFSGTTDRKNARVSTGIVYRF
jgi:opacity protein-like surface antigen